MNTKHTPGPWTAWNVDHGRIRKNLRINAGIFHKIAIVENREVSAEEYANARLIAAAPELLSCLEALAGDCKKNVRVSDSPVENQKP